MENKTNKQLLPNSVISPTISLKDFFKSWLIILRPYHHLTDKQIDLAATFLKKRYELSKDILNDVLLDEILMSDSKKNEIKAECGITTAHFQVMMTVLRKNNFIKENNRINPKYIPNVSKDNPKNFSLMIMWKFNDEE